MATIAEKLKEYREGKGWNQQQMTDLLQLKTQQLYSLWERGKKKLNEDELYLIYQRTGIVQDFVVIPNEEAKWPEVAQKLNDIKSSLGDILDEQLYSKSQHLAMIEVEAGHRGGDAEIQRIHNLTFVAFEAMKKMGKTNAGSQDMV